jgi:transposase-like protein
MSQQTPIDLDAELKKCKTMDDLTGKNGLLQRLLGPMIEKMLECEMDEQLGYERHSRQAKDSDNRRNGKTQKIVKGSFGPVEITIPRDRDGEFEPKLIKKHQRSISSFDEKIISMYAKGMTTRDIQSHVQELYGAEISSTTISNITEKVMEEAQGWQSRPLAEIYAVLYLDAIHYKVREGGRIVSKASYTCFGVDLEGRKDVLGIWVGESEGARFWLKVCTELKNRGVRDVFIACIDGLKGFPEAINAVFPQTTIQLCIIHLIRNSIKYVPYKHYKEFIGDLQAVYKAFSEGSAIIALNLLNGKWGEKYPMAVRPWVNQWENIKTFLDFPEPLRKIIYTTNAVEALHRQFRKVTKNRAVFPSDDALTKLLYLAIRDISKKWTMPIRDWRSIITCLLAVYGDRVNVRTGA